MPTYVKYMAGLMLAVLASINSGYATAAQEENQEENKAEAFIDAHEKFTGLYRASREYIIVGLIPAADIIYAQWMESGAMRFMGAEGGSEFRYSPTRNLTDATEGEISFRKIRNGEAGELIWTDETGQRRTAYRVQAKTQPVSFNNGQDITLTGVLVRPSGAAHTPAVVLVPQSGRYDIWDVGMWMLSRGVAVLAYDERNADYGGSAGPAVTGPYQDQRTVYATDAAAAVAYLRSREDIDPERIGIAGWSGGGFTAAMVAGADPSLAFYVNIAGDASPGFEQASHMFVARLLREGFSDEDAAAARVLVDMHFGVADGRVSWDDYQAEIARVSETGWYQYLTSRYTIPFTDPEGVTEIGDYQAQWTPERTYGKIAHTPTLGVFFEYDHSSAPSSPYHFQKSLQGAGNGDYSVVVIPDVHHGGFVLNGQGFRFDTSKLTHRSPLLIDTVADWVERHTAR